MSARARLAAAAAFVALCATPVEPARACDCEEITMSDALTGADAVVVATFVRVIDHSPPRSRRIRVVEYVARVDRAWKGARPGDTISLWDTGSSCDTIGRPWRGQWVFFARRDEQGRLTPGHCDAPFFSYRTRLDAIVRAIDAAARAAPHATPAPPNGRP